MHPNSFASGPILRLGQRGLVDTLEISSFFALGWAAVGWCNAKYSGFRNRSVPFESLRQLRGKMEKHSEAIAVFLLKETNTKIGLQLG